MGALWRGQRGRWSKVKFFVDPGGSVSKARALPALLERVKGSCALFPLTDGKVEWNWPQEMGWGSAVVVAAASVPRQTAVLVLKRTLKGSNPRTCIWFLKGHRVGLGLWSMPPWPRVTKHGAAGLAPGLLQGNQLHRWLRGRSGIPPARAGSLRSSCSFTSVSFIWKLKCGFDTSSKFLP